MQDKQNNTENPNTNAGFSFSSFRPGQNVNELSESSAELISAPGQKPAINTNTVLIALLAVLLVLLGTGAIYFFASKKPAARTVATAPVVAEQNAPDPSKEFDSLSKDIDELLGSQPRDNEKLYDLAAQRFEKAVLVGNEEKMIQSADFAAAMADSLRRPDEALTFYDLHILIRPDPKILEAKFRVCQRLGVKPNHPGEQQLYKTNTELVRACDQLATDSATPLAEMDFYTRILLERAERQRQINNYKDASSSYLVLLKSWLARQKALNLMSRLMAMQKGSVQMYDLTMDTEHPEIQLKQINTIDEFQHIAAFSKRTWMPLQPEPGIFAYISDDLNSLVIVKLDSNNQIESTRLVYLPACSGATFAGDVVDLLPPLVYGAGADEIPAATDVVRNDILYSQKSDENETSNRVRILVAKDKLAGFEINRNTNVNWAPSVSVNKIISLLPKDKATKKKYLELSYLEKS